LQLGALFNPLSSTVSTASGIAREASGGTCPRTQVLGAHQHSFYNNVFFEKNCKNHFSAGWLCSQNPIGLRQLATLPLDLHIVTLTYYYKLFEYVSNAKSEMRFFITLKIEQKKYSKCFAFFSCTAPLP